MNKEKNNNKVMLVGTLLIALVFVFTLFRSDLGKKDTISKNSQVVLNYPKINPGDVKNKIKNNEPLAIIDMRTPDNYAMEHLTDSINALSEESLKAIPKEKTVIIVGYSDKDEEYSKIVDYLKSNSYKNFFILRGGIDAWKEIGGETISVGNPYSFVDNSKVIYISPEDLKNIVDNQNYPKFILDVRAKELFDGGHIAGAVNIAADDLEKSKGNIPYGKEIFVYGDTELQGFQGGVRLYDLNFLNCKVLKGGLTAWKDKGFEVVR